jgi:CubicO group peptidase (beta-lactamase class C family)
LHEALAGCARDRGFSGVVAITRGGTRQYENALGLANRAAGSAITLATRFAIASGTKTFTALAVMQLVEAGALALSTPAREILDADLPLVDDRVTVEHLLAHRSGIGDYFDETVVGAAEFVPPVPPETLDHQEAWLPVLDGHPQVSEPGQTFAYNNSGYVLLGLIAERVSGVRFSTLVETRVCAAAGLTATSFHRSDHEAPDLAVGYLDDGSTNARLMPRLGAGDGGLSTTLDDVDRFWHALFGGRIVTGPTRAEITRPRSDSAAHAARYGLGVWLHATGPAVILEGCDAGISFRSAYDPARDLTLTVMSSTTDGAWPLARLLAEELG